MANRYPHGAAQIPGMVPSAPGSVPLGVVGQQQYRVMPQQYYQPMPMNTGLAMTPVNLSNEMQQGIYQIAMHPSGHMYGQPIMHAPGYPVDENRRRLDQQQTQIKEKLLKERDYQKQQQRLREFSVATPKLEADKLIRNMFGPMDDPKRKQERVLGLQNVNQNVKPAPNSVHDLRPGASPQARLTQKARDWSNLDDLHNVFSDPNASDLPAWCQAGAPVPPVYAQVENYVTRNGIIDTSLLYPVLVSSGLSRETLGQIWTLANRHTPGLLDRSELYAALALVALAQNACQITSIEILHTLHQAPVPLLNQVTAQPPTAVQVTLDAAEPAFAPSLEPPTSSEIAIDDDFDDFKSASNVPSLNVITSGRTLSAASIGSRLAHHNLTHSPGAVKTSESKLIVDTDDFSDFQQAELSVTSSPSDVSDIIPVNIPETRTRGETGHMAEKTETNRESWLAPNAGVGTHMGMQSATSKSVFADLMGGGEEDKYSVFRTLAAVEETAGKDDDDFGDFLSGAGVDSDVNSTTDYSASQYNLDAIPSENSRTLFHSKRQSPDETDFEFSDFQSAVVSQDSHSQSLSSMISDMHGFHIHSLDVDPDDFFGSFLASDGSGQKEPSDVITKTSPKSTPSIESQSVSSLDFGTYELQAGAGSELQLGRHGSVPSLDLRVAESPEQEEDVAPTHSAPVKNDGSMANQQQPFANMMGTSQGLVDRYSLIRNEKPTHTDFHSYEWQRCLDNCHKVISDAFKIFNGISNSNVSHEVIGSEEGENYLKNIIEIYRISRRIATSAKRTKGLDPKIHSTIDDIETEWNKLLSFVVGSPVLPDEECFNFSASALAAEDVNLACGVCLLDVDASIGRSNPRDLECFKLTYGGRQYHSACANFWVNCVDSLLPSLAFKHNLL